LREGSGFAGRKRGGGNGGTLQEMATSGRHNFDVFS
jgi:hypothetical protein